MKVIFLDIDGVLNCELWQMASEDWEEDIKNDVPPVSVAAVMCLNEIIKRTGASVVISSTWRNLTTREKLVGKLESCGFKGAVIGQTPGRGGHRGSEIRCWLIDHPEVTHFVILDDDSDMEPFFAHFVKTQYETGLLDTHVDQAVAILERDGYQNET